MISNRRSSGAGAAKSEHVQINTKQALIYSLIYEYAFQINQIIESYFFQMQPRKWENRIDLILNGARSMASHRHHQRISSSSNNDGSSGPPVPSNTLRIHEKPFVHKSPHSPFPSLRARPATARTFSLFDEMNFNNLFQTFNYLLDNYVSLAVPHVALDVLFCVWQRSLAHKAGAVDFSAALIKFACTIKRNVFLAAHKANVNRDFYLRISSFVPNSEVIRKFFLLS